jgi:D-serine ammonia-lyase
MSNVDVSTDVGIGVSNYPSSPIDNLRNQYVGRLLQDVEGTPLGVVDQSISHHNCELMLEACESLGVFFRAHVKTHKVGSKND